MLSVELDTFLLNATPAHMMPHTPRMELVGSYLYHPPVASLKQETASRHVLSNLARLPPPI